MAHTHTNENMLVRGWHWVTGRRAPKLREQRAKLSVFGALLLVVQSVSMILVFGHAELAALFTGTLMARMVMTAVLALLVLVTIAADGAALKTLGRIGALTRNRASGMVAEHIAYLLFVLGIEAVTLGIALYTIEQNPMALLSTEPLLPASSWLVLGLIVLRVLLMGFTFIQQHLVEQELPAGWETLADQGAQLIGGHAQRLMEGMELTSADLGGVFDAYARIRTPQPRRPTFWNGWLVRRDAEHQTRLEAYRRDVIQSMEALGHNVRDELTAQFRAREAALLQQVASAQATVEQVQANVRDELLTALLYLAQHGTLPEEWQEAHPALAGFTLPQGRVGGGRGAGRGGGGLLKEPNTNSERYEAFLQAMGLEQAKRPANRRGVWLFKSDLGKLVEGTLPASVEKTILGGKSKGGKDGVNSIVLVDEAMQVLLDHHLANEQAREMWTRYCGESDDNSSQEGEGEGQRGKVTILRQRQA